MAGDMTIPCVECGRLFGGDETLRRHLLKRENRCKTEGELKRAGLYSDIEGIWRRTGSRTSLKQAPLMDLRTLPRAAKTVRRHPRRAAGNAAGVRRVSPDAGNGTKAQGATGGRG